MAVLLIIVVIAGIVVFTKINNKKTEDVKENKPKEEFTNVLDDGTRLNTSNQMKKTKTVDGLEIRNMQITEKENATLLLATITNNTEQARGGYPVDIIIKDKDGKEIKTISAYIGEIAPKASEQLSVTTSFDYANAYDIEIVKK